MRHPIQALIASFRDEQATWEPTFTQAIEALSFIYEFPQGKCLIWFLMTVTDPFSSSYTGNSDSYYISALQDVGRLIMHMLLETKPEAMAELLSIGVTPNKNPNDGGNNDD